MTVDVDPGVHAPPIGAWGERHVAAMGSTATIIAGDAPLGLLDWACHELERLERSWSRFLPDSELSELNESAGRWFPMSETLAAAVGRAIDLYRLTDGLFDPTVHDRLVELGYDRNFRAVTANDPKAPLPGAALPGISGIERDGDHVHLPEGVRLDLGGVGKGLAADLLATGLLERGARSACVSLGGDIRVAGLTPEEAGWQIPVEDPWGGPTVSGTVPLRDCAIVTSTTLIRTWKRSGRTLHHIIDPRTGEPAGGDVVAAVVRGPEAWLAEGLAKAAVISGRDRGGELLDRSDVDGWLACADGTLLATDGAPLLLAPPPGRTRR